MERRFVRWSNRFEDLLAWTDWRKKREKERWLIKSVEFAGFSRLGVLTVLLWTTGSVRSR